MKTETGKAIKVLSDKATETKDSGDALRYSQAALNLAHAEATMSHITAEGNAE